MDYNTSREKLRLREYGRHVQKLVQYAIKVKDENEKQKTVETIINIMGYLNPHMKNNEQFKQKVWDHIFHISEYNLDVNSPYPIPDKRDDPFAKVEKRIQYSQSRIRHRQYGKNIHNMVKKAIDMEDKEKQKDYIEVICNYMKLVHKNWSKEIVSDDMIRGDLTEISKNKLQLDEDVTLQTLNIPPQNNRSNKRGRSSNNSGRHGGRSHHKGGRGRRY